MGVATRNWLRRGDPAWPAAGQPNHAPRPATHHIGGHHARCRHRPGVLANAPTIGRRSLPYLRRSFSLPRRYARALGLEIFVDHADTVRITPRRYARALGQGRTSVPVAVRRQTW